MKKLFFPGAAVLLTLCAGCSSVKTEEFDPRNPSENKVRSLTTVSQTECFIAARAAAEDAMASPAYTHFLERYKKKHDGQLPLMQISRYLRNDTNDPELNMNLITDELSKALRDSGKVRITLATGRDAKGTFSEARDLKNDKNFNQATVARSGTLNAPNLSLEGAVITNIVRDGNTTVKVTSFNLKIGDIETGEEIWSYNEPLGVKKTKTTFGF